MPRYSKPERNPQLERKVVALQRRIAAVDGLLAERNELLVQLWSLDYSQRHMAKLLNKANAAAGVKDITPDAVQKAIKSVGGARRVERP